MTTPHKHRYYLRLTDVDGRVLVERLDTEPDESTYAYADDWYILYIYSDLPANVAMLYTGIFIGAIESKILDKDVQDV